MQITLKHQQLNSKGVSHHLLLPVAAVLVVVGIGGYIMQRSSSAATNKPCVSQTFSTKTRNNHVCNKYIGQILKPTYFSGTPSNRYTVTLSKAVKKYQAKAKISAKTSGIVNAATWKKMCADLAASSRTTLYGQVECKKIMPTTTPTPTPIPIPSPTPALVHTFTTASWNANSDNPNVIADEILTIIGNTQIIGVQSVHHLDQRDGIKNKLICATCKYAGYLPGYNNGTATPASYPIVWDKAAFSQVGDGSYRTMSDALTVGTSTYAAHYATWVRLQSKVNGKQIIVVNTQLISGVESVGKATANTAQLDNYKAHMSKLTALVTELKAANVPIYIVGNFGVNYRYDKNAYVSYFPYASFKALDVRSNWDVTSLSGIKSTDSTQTVGNRLVDYIFTWQRSDVTPNATTIGNSAYGSTYKPVFYTSTIK